MSRTRHLEFWPKRLAHSLPVPKTSLYDNLTVSARRYPDKAAIHYYGGSVSYRQFLMKLVPHAMTSRIPRQFIGRRLSILV